MNSIYTSTGKKILRHLSYLQKFQSEGIINPISLQIAPTSRCNLNCVFCSNKNRAAHEDLDYSEMIRFVKSINPKTIEWTGGGDPTQYKYIADAIRLFHSWGIKQGFITNGIDLAETVGTNVVYLEWVRVSLNSLDYVRDIDLPVPIKTLGFSYVLNSKTTDDVLSRMEECVNKYNPKYVRIVPDCQTSIKELKEINEHNSKVVRTWGFPYFYQAKTFTHPKRCWWGYFKPFLLHDGFIYPCSSVVLNDSADRSFHEKFRWMKMNDFAESCKHPTIPFDCKDCTNCVFGEQNELVEAAIRTEMEDFI